MHFTGRSHELTGDAYTVRALFEWIVELRTIALPAP
jgi:hypothetical protein